VTAVSALQPERMSGAHAARTVGVALTAVVLWFGLINPVGNATPASSAINPFFATFLHQQHVATVPVLVQAKGDVLPLERAVTTSGGKVRAQYPSVNSFAATVPSAVADTLNHDARVARLGYDAPVKLLGSAVNSANLLNRYEAVEQVPTAWSQGLDGSGVQVAVVDSGVSPHDDLVNVSSTVPGNSGSRLLEIATNSAATDPWDHVGHGTHVAGIVAGNGYDSNGQYMGVAPNSLVVGLKVSDDQGNATEGDVINGLEWVYLANQHGFNIRVVNLSLSSTVAQSYNYSPLDAMVEKLWSSGVVVVASAGNVNSTYSTVMYAPGNDPYVITVGSVDDFYQTNLSNMSMASWSPYGNTQDGYSKPELVADGSHVVSLLDQVPGGSILANAHPANVVGSSYFMMGGTSMAAPQVAGMAALMLQQNPGLSNNVVKRMLMNGSNGFGTVNYTQYLCRNNGSHGCGLVSSTALSQSTSSNANGGLGWSYSFSWSGSTGNPRAIVNSGMVLIDGYQTGLWNNTAWNNTAWNNTAWNNTAWNNTAWNNTAWNGTYFTNTAWNNTAWNNTAWNNTAWNSTAWNNTAWNNTAWNNTAWNNTAWNNTAWNNTAWNNTSWNNTSWNSAGADFR